jgi:hypothetical protein
VSPVTFRAPATFKVPVTLDEAATKPPNRSSVDVAKFPRFVTEASVSLSDRRYAGQPVPFARQTAKPITVAVAKFPELATIEEPVAELNESKPVEAKLVDVALWSDVSPVTFNVPPFNAPIVAVLMLALVPLAAPNPSEFVNKLVDVTPARVVSPVTLSAPITFNVPVTEDEAATNPPKNSRVVVVNDPRAVTVANVSLNTVPAGQPVPFARQTAKPITVAVAKLAELAIIVVPLAVLNPREPTNNEVEVASTSVVLPVTFKVPPFKAPMVAVLMLALVPVAALKPTEFVKRLVDVTPASVESPVTFRVPATFKVPVTLDEAATNPPNKLRVDVAKFPRFVTEARVSLSDRR